MGEKYRFYDMNLIDKRKSRNKKNVKAVNRKKQQKTDHVML